MNGLMSAVALCTLLLSSGEAFAKRGKRDGFTFGSTIRLVEADEPSIATNAGGNSKRAVSEIQTVRPHLGYVFGGFFHLGLDATFESEEREEALNGQSANEKIESHKEANLSGAGIVTRFLFGNVMFFETGMGYYERRSVLTNKYLTETSSDEFTGTKEELRTRAVGLGYHVGAGVEFPIGNGFQVMGNYLVHFYELKPYRNSAGIKRDSEKESRKELNFGISYYYR